MPLTHKNEILAHFWPVAMYSMLTHMTCMAPSLAWQTQKINSP